MMAELEHSALATVDTSRAFTDYMEHRREGRTIRAGQEARFVDFCKIRENK